MESRNYYANQGPVIHVGAVRNLTNTTSIYHNVAIPSSGPINFGVFEPEKYFTGRSHELEKLEEFFKQSYHSPVVVSGLGGIGKTQLVRKFIHEKGTMYENVIWINSENNESIYDSFKALATRTLGVQRVQISNALNLRELKPLIEEVLDKLCQKDTLLIYDNVESIEDLQLLLPLKPSGRRPNVVITSRIQDFDEGFDVIQLKPWSISEATEYVVKALENSNDLNHDIELFVEKLQYFPLALRQATAYIKYQRKTKTLSISDYVAKCYTQEMLNSNVFQRNATNLYDWTTLTTWSITIDTIQRDEMYGQIAVKLLNLMAYLAPDEIQRDWFKSLIDKSENREDNFEEHLVLAVSLLINYSMIDGQDKQATLSIHRLVQEVIKLKLSETHQDKTILRVALQLIAKLIDGEKIHTIPTHATTVFVFALKFADLIAEFKTLPRQILHRTIEIGKYQLAKLFADIILEPLTNSLEEDDFLAVKSGIANTYMVNGHNIEALKINEEILEKLKTTLGAEHRNTLATQHNVACLYSRLGRYSEALQSHQDVFEKKKKILGDDHPGTLSTMHNIASSYTKLGRYSEALQTFQEVSNKRTIIFGESHPVTLGSRHAIADSYNNLRRYSEALKLHQEVLDKRKSILGEAHPDTLNTLNNLGNSYSGLGRHSEALELFQDVFDKRKTILGKYHPYTLDTTNNLAVTYIALGRYSESLQLHQELFDKRKTLFGGDHPHTVVSMSNMGSAYSELGRYSEALQLFREVFDKQKIILGADHPTTLVTMSNIANSYNGLRRHSEALNSFEELLDKQITILGDDHPDTLVTSHNVAYSYYKLERFSEAVKSYEEVFDKRKRILGEYHPHTIHSRLILDVLRAKLGRGW